MYSAREGHNGYEESRLYAPDFSTEFRKGTDHMKKLTVIGMGPGEYESMTLRAVKGA